MPSHALSSASAVGASVGGAVIARFMAISGVRGMETSRAGKGASAA
jgi:hypothetical protein